MKINSIGKKLALVALSAMVVMGCTSGDDATRVLTQQGYTDIQVGGYAFMSCSDKDTFATSFKATSPSGERVSGAVCKGFFKGSTIRFD